MYANVNRIIYVAADVCILYIQKPYILPFRIFPLTMMPSSILFHNFVKSQGQSFHIQKSTQMNIYCKFIQ